MLGVLETVKVKLQKANGGQMIGGMACPAVEGGFGPYWVDDGSC